MAIFNWRSSSACVMDNSYCGTGRSYRDYDAICMGSASVDEVGSVDQSAQLITEVHATGEVPTVTPVTTTSQPTPSSDVVAHIRYVYVFAGFKTLTRAIQTCRGMSLPMPKTASDRHALKEAVKVAVEAGKMSRHWPKNTVWLGGHWDSIDQRWKWADGTAVSKGFVRGARSPAQQLGKPYLCMNSDGNIHDSDLGDNPHVFGVMCEQEAGAVAHDSDMSRGAHLGQLTTTIPTIAFKTGVVLASDFRKLMLPQ